MMSEPDKTPWYAEFKKYRSTSPPPLRTLPLDLDETGEHLNAEFAKCGRQRAIAEDKITNPRHNLLYPVRMALRKAADAIRENCDRIRVKIQIHRRVKRDEVALPKPYGEAMRRYTAAASATIKSEGESPEEFVTLRTAVETTREAAVTPFLKREEDSQKPPADRASHI